MKILSDIQTLKDIMAKNLKLYIEKSGKNQTDIARELGIPEMTMSNWVKAKTYPRADKIQLMADYFGIRRLDLTEERPSNIVPVNSGLVKIPVIGEIACGEPILATQNIEDFIYEPADTLPNGEIFALKAKGDSMEPTIPNGAIVLIREQNEVAYGEIAAVLVNGDLEATLKRIKKQGDTVFLMSDNPKYEPYIIDEQNPARIIGKAISFKVTL